MSTHNIYLALVDQLDKLARHNRQGSFHTRRRYYEAMKRFCFYLASSFHLQKLSNISAKHFVSYVLYLQDNGRAAMENKCRSLDDLPLALRVEDLMPILGIGRNTAYELVRSGQIRSIRVGRKIRVPKDAVGAFLGESNDATLTSNIGGLSR